MSRYESWCAEIVAQTALLTDLLLLIYRRRSVAVLEVLGDAELFDFWWERVQFG
jgi:hypothetical protein